MTLLKIAARTAFALIALTAVSFTPAQAIDTTQLAGYSSQIFPHNAGGGLSYLPDGDALAFTLDYVTGPAVQRIDLNGDGIPATPQVLKQFDTSVFPSFVEVAPDGTYAVFGVTGSETFIYRIDLATNTVDKWFDLPGNYDWTFIDNGHAYASWNPGFFDPSIPNHISYVDLSPPVPTVKDLLLVSGTPSGPIGVSQTGDLFYIKGTFTYPPPAGSSLLMEFYSGDIASALSNNTLLTEAHATRIVTLDGGFDLVVHATSPTANDVYVSAFGDTVFRILDNATSPEPFLMVNDNTGPGITYMAMYRPTERFDSGGSAGAKLAFGLATDFFSTNSVVQVKPDTYDADLDGTTDSSDLCPLSAIKVSPGICGCGVADTDSDGDGTADCQDLCPTAPGKTTPGTCGCFVPETDDDNDQTPNCVDQCPNDAIKTTAGICGCSVADTDSDSDGTPNCQDQCPSDSAKLSAGICGCGLSDSDSDADGTADCNDSCPADTQKTAPGTCGCGVSDADANTNGTADCQERNDNCAAGEDCLFESLAPTACAGANGFLEQVNIATVVNLQALPLQVRIVYRDQSGVTKGSSGAVIGSNLKRDFIINELGLAANTYGTVCVFTDAVANGAWTGGVSVYKPNVRSASGAGFGVNGFDFALFHSFTNPRQGKFTQPLNTFHLGVDPTATVANWLSISDAQAGDGLALNGTLTYFDQNGQPISSVGVAVPDGGRVDYAGHEGIAGSENKDSVGMVRFTPDTLPGGGPQLYYFVLARYFYDCQGASCPNFRTAFVVPHRPATSGITTGGVVPTVEGQIAVIELNNLNDTPAFGGVAVYNTTGAANGSANVPVPALGTRHYIVNKEFNSQGLLEANSVGSAQVSGTLSAISVFYKLDASGQLLHAYAAPLVGAASVAQVSEFNSFLDHENIGEFFNPSSSAAKVNVRVLDFANIEIYQADLDLAPKASSRTTFSLPKDSYGSIIVQAAGADGVLFKNLVKRADEYVVPFLGR